MVTLWVNSVFLSLLIANEGLRYWLFLSDFAYQFWGRVVVYLRPRSVCRHFWWLAAALLPGLSLSFAGGLSSPGLICCFAMGLRGAGWRSCGCVSTVCWANGFMAFLPVLRSPACSGFASSCGFSSPVWFTPFVMGSPLWGRGSFVLDRNEGSCVSLSLLGCFFFLSLPLGFWSPYG